MYPANTNIHSEYIHNIDFVVGVYTVHVRIFGTCRLPHVLEDLLLEVYMSTVLSTTRTSTMLARTGPYRAHIYHLRILHCIQRG